MPGRLVADLIGSETFSLPGSSMVLDAARLMAEKRIGALLVVEEGRLKGIFSERDALFRVLALGRDPGITPISGVMTPTPKTVRPDASAVSALLMMRDGEFRHLPVVESGEVLGVISLRDFMGAELQEVDEQLLYAVE